MWNVKVNGIEFSGDHDKVAAIREMAIRNGIGCSGLYIKK